MTITRAQQLADWKNPRSVEFRTIVKGWSFTDEDKLPAMLERARPFAWLPEHFDILECIERIIEKRQKSKD